MQKSRTQTETALGDARRFDANVSSGNVIRLFWQKRWGMPVRDP